jgi:hypothetical protein
MSMDPMNMMVQTMRLGVLIGTLLRGFLVKWGVCKQPPQGTFWC